jgi:transposase InsO family protein
VNAIPQTLTNDRLAFTGIPSDFMHDLTKINAVVQYTVQRHFVERVSTPVGKAVLVKRFGKTVAERTSRPTYRTHDEAKTDVFDYIERFYNPRRRHSTNGPKATRQRCAQPRTRADDQPCLNS